MFKLQNPLERGSTITPNVFWTRLFLSKPRFIAVPRAKALEESFFHRRFLQLEYDEY